MKINKLSLILIVIIIVLSSVIGVLSFNVVEQSKIIINYENSFGEMPPP